MFMIPVKGQGEVAIKFTGGDRMGVSGFKKDALYSTNVPLIQFAIENSVFFGRHIFLVEQYETPEEIKARLEAKKREEEGYTETSSETSKYIPDGVTPKTDPEECVNFTDACFYLMNKYDIPKDTIKNIKALKKFAIEHCEEFPNYEAFNQ